MKSNLIQIFFLPILFLSFQLNWELPSKWDSALSVEISGKGGMRPTNWKFSIYKDSCVYFDEYNPKSNKKWKLSKKQLGSLLSKLKENKVLEIETNTMAGIYYDKSTEILAIKYKDQYFSATSSASTNIEEKSKDRFYTIFNYIKSLSK